MSHRQFTDSAGTVWDVWDVHPTTAARTLANLCLEAGDPTDGGRNPVAPALADGWLCFSHGVERRRLAPIPSGWTDLPEGDLEHLRDSAARVLTFGERRAGSEEPASRQTA